LAGGLENSDGLGVAQALERPLDDELQALGQFLVDKLDEQSDLLRAMPDHVKGHGLEERLRQIHVALQIAKGHFGFDHPEFRRMARGVGILRPKGGSEGVHVRQGAGERLRYEHQNLRDERAEAFASYLYAGVYDYSYVARATTPGNFVVPPAKAEEMYAPETFGRSSSDRVIVF
jgi:hypothetical protein